MAEYVDRRGATRDRPMEVLALGVGRTGTDSLREALKMLGYDDCYHGYSLVLENPPDAYLWNEAMDAKFLGEGKPWTRAEWDQLLGGCRAISDLPCVLFYEELILAYLEAKVVLTEPPMGFKRWYESCLATLITTRNDWTLDFWALFSNEIWITRRTFWRCFDYFWSKDFANNAELVYNMHHDRIKRLVPEDRLLEYSVSSGWGELCTFLGKPVPDAEFPSGNARPEFFNKILGRYRRRKQDALGNMAGWCIGIGAVVGLFAYGARVAELLRG